LCGVAEALCGVAEALQGVRAERAVKASGVAEALQGVLAERAVKAARAVKATSGKVSNIFQPFAEHYCSNIAYTHNTDGLEGMP
jgi:hypothetical protein